MKELVAWKSGVKALETVLASHSVMLKGAPQISRLSLPDDVIDIVLHKLHRLLVPEFVRAMRTFMDGLADDFRPCLISEQTACARQNGMFVMIQTLCRYQTATLWHMRRFPTLVVSVTQKLTELKILNDNKQSSHRRKERGRDLSGMIGTWEKLSVTLRLAHLCAGTREK